MLYALIMAGGKGRRFWPLSTENKPKQFLKLISEKTMIQMTVDRIKTIIPMERIFICTGEKYLNIVKEQLPEINEGNIIIEPEGRNTTPCIALSSLIIKRYDADATMLVLPSDHLIEDEEKFRKVILEATKFVNENSNSIVTLGMKPTRAETGYGYIKCSNVEKQLGENIIRKVDKFVEKPNLEVAEQYVKDESYLWNGGMFIWKADNIINKIKKYSNYTYKALKEVYEIDEENIQKYINDNYRKTESISIDYAVLEKSENIYVIPSDFGWDDIGTWKAVERYNKKDFMGNICIGNVLTNESKNNLIVAVKDKVILNNVNDIYIVENDGKIVIGRKEDLII